MTHGGCKKSRSFKPSKLGMVFEDGSFYEEGEVQRLALILIRKPPLKEVEDKQERRWRKRPRS